MKVEAVNPRRFFVVAALAYFVLTALMMWPLIPVDSHRIIGCACGDPSLQVWFLNWVPHAILHGQNPFFTTYMDYPLGANLASNTTVPFLGIVFYPVTLVFGPIATFNLLIWLAYPLSAVSAFYVIRRWSGSNVAAFVAGLLYGFSTYAVHQGYGHLALSFVPVPPLIYYALYRVVVQQSARPRRWGTILGVLVTIQFLISAEVLVTTLMMGIAGIVIGAVTSRREITRERLTYIGSALVPGVVLAAAVLAIPVWYELFGKFHVAAPNQNTIYNAYRTDLLGAIVPTSLQRFGPASLKAIGNQFSGNAAENGSYLGLPLVILFLGCWVRFFRHRGVRLAGLLALGAWIISLGPILIVKTHLTSIKLPFYYLTQFQIFQDVLPVRFSLYVTFFVVTTVTLSIGVWSRQRGELGHDHRRTRTTRPVGAVLVAALVLASIAAIVPTWPIPTQSTDGTTPAFFTSPAANAIPDGSVILTYPYALPEYSQAPILWQAQTGFRWKMTAAYVEVPGSFPRTVSAAPWPTQPYPVVNYLRYWEGVSQGLQLTTPVPIMNSSLIEQTREYVRNYHVSTAVIALSAINTAPVIRLFTAAFGTPISEGGVDVWFHLTPSTHS